VSIWSSYGVLDGRMYRLPAYGLSCRYSVDDQCFRVDCTVLVPFSEGSRFVLAEDLLVYNLTIS